MNVVKDPVTLPPQEATEWPGPSLPGGTIADPLRIGVWEDGASEEITLTAPVKIAGMAGSGKTSLGWSLTAEAVTRRDCAVFGIDTVSRLHMRPLQPALHAFAGTTIEASTLADWLYRQARDRADDLADAGLTSWQPGCRDRYGELMSKWLIWCEEAPTFFENLSSETQARWLRGLGMARKAGIIWVVSLQRGDVMQLPSITRGQFGNICLAANDDGDSGFNLSGYQEETDVCRPDLWGWHYPGMHYIDIPGISRLRRVMPARSYYWGGNATRLAAHSAAWPAGDRPLPLRVAETLAECMAGAASYVS